MVGKSFNNFSAPLMNSISTFDITQYPLLDILKDIKTGRIQLPDFQRDWVWNDFQVRRVLASISLAYPIGAVMMLQQGNHQQQFKPRLIDSVTNPSPQPPSLLILDGQQRLTCLYMVLLSSQPVHIKDPKSQKLLKKWYYLDIKKCFDPNSALRSAAALRYRREAILAFPSSKQLRSRSGKIIDVSTASLEYSTELFPLSQVFFFSDWRSEYSKFWGYNSEKLQLIEALELEVVKKFEHYQMSVIQLQDSLPKQAVYQIFEDTNTSGCDLNFFDLMSASYCAENFSLRDDWKCREGSLKSFKVLRCLRNTDFVQAVSLVASFVRRHSAYRDGVPFERLPAISCRRMEVLKLSPEEYHDCADSVTKGFEEAARFLHTLKIFDASDMAYPIQLVALAAILTLLGKQSKSERIRSLLKHWLWSGIFGEMYTRGHEIQAAEDVSELPLWLKSDVPTMISSANFSVTRLLSARKRYGAVYQGLSALLRLSGAIDWSTGEEINDVVYFEQKVESHHIFPVAWCKKQGIAPLYYNCLVNRTPLTAKTNKKIGSKSPSVYLSKLEKEGILPARLDEMLRLHAIEPKFLRQDDFEGFFAARTKALMELIDRAMGKHLIVDVEY
jgi:hypothetical protein